MRFTAQFIAPTINVAREQQRLNKFLRNKLKQGAKVWVTAAFKRVPVWSGMARASLFAIAELANARIVIGPLKAPSRVPEGRRLGSASFETSDDRFTFTVQTEVPHYVVQDVRSTRPRGSPKAPWRSFESGQKAFEKFVQRIKLPAPKIRRKVVARI